MPDDEYRTKYSAAQKMQLLKSQQAKLEIRAMPAHSQLKLKLPASKDEEENALKWKHRTKYIYEAERISLKLKEIAAECTKDIELRVTMDDIIARIDTLKKARDEYYQYLQAQNDIFDKQIKLLDELQTMQIAELTNKVHRLSDTFKNIDAKLSVIKAKLQNITNHQAKKTLIQSFIEAFCALF
uniref:Uncharacterized protein n=1 Tax=Wuchereria bancrofti TaxID=6293 RepID=A0AAF5PU65_WUCBA